MVWEYKTIKISPEKSFLTGRDANVDMINDELTALGKQGWELVSAFDTTRSGDFRDIVMVFKRPGN